MASYRRLPWLYPLFPVLCPIRFSIALFHPLPPQTVHAIFPHTAFQSSSSRGFRRFLLGSLV